MQVQGSVRLLVCAGAVGGVVAAVLLALCLWFVCRRKRNKQVGERRVTAQPEKQQTQQKPKAPSGPWLGFLRRKKKQSGGGASTGMSAILLVWHF